MDRPTLDDFAADLDAMVRDPEIQRELAIIEREFRATDGDGLYLDPSLFSGIGLCTNEFQGIGYE